MGARGEGEIDLGKGLPVRVLFTNRALIEAEKALGKTVLQIVADISKTQTGMGELATLLKIGMGAAAGGPMPLDEAVDVLDEAGFGRCFQAVASAITDVMSYEPATGGANPPA
jgi:hypothetical protein